MMTSLIPLRRIDNLFDALFDASVAGNGQLDEVLSLTPRADILEGDQEYRIEMDLPGVTRDDLAIELEGPTLTITARRDAARPDSLKVLRGERSAKAEFKRTFTLGDGVDPARISAQLERGVLAVTLGKTEQVLPRRIEVK